MNCLNQSFLLLNPQLEKILQTKFLPDPEIFTSLNLDACFNYFHRKDPLLNYTKLQNNELLNINPLIENKISRGSQSPGHVKYNRFVDFLQIINNKDDKFNINNKLPENDNLPDSQANAMNLEIDIQDDEKEKKYLKVKKFNKCNIRSNIPEANRELNNNKKNNNISNRNENGRINPNFKIIEENVWNKNQVNLINGNQGMLVQLKVKDEIINGIIFENNKIQCAVRGCAKIFKNKYKLNDHLVMHSINKKFVCKFDDCGKEFKRRQTLNRHIRSFHKMIKRYQCKYCSEVYLNPNCNIIYIFK
jgi:hypothetical protein